MTVAEALNLLELPPNFTATELGKAYRHALMVWHPDRFPGNEELIKKAQERTRLIIEAFTLLSPLAASEETAGTANQAGNVPTARETGAKTTPRPVRAVSVPQAQSLTSSGKKHGRSSDKATWIILGSSMLGAVVLIAVLSKRSQNAVDALPSAALSTVTDSVGRTAEATADSANRDNPAVVGLDALPKGEAATVVFLRKAAEQGDPEAQRKLGVSYFYGKGVAIDGAEAVKWWRKAAEQGDAKAQNVLGFCYYDGLGVSKNEAEAVEWWRKAAEDGDANGQLHLGERYANGEGVPRDESEAERWYRKAAAQNLPIAQYYLGKLYADGKIGSISHAARLGSPEYLSPSYGAELGPNYVEAHVWLNLAGANGVDDARRASRAIELMMNREEITEALVRAKEIFGKLKGIEKK